MRDNEGKINSTQTTATVTGPSEDFCTLIYDRAGNLVFDGTFFYQYDGFNRLVQVNESGSLTGECFDSNGRIMVEYGLQPGSVVASFVYDGLGRLIEKIDSDGSIQDFFYDGVRRIQEIRPGLQNPYREYIYGPKYVDEFILQVDSEEIPWYMIQDANYNIVALLDTDGIVVEQYTYDPYGALAVVDTAVSRALINKVGHQGLFFDNFSSDGLSLTMKGLYYNRNRWYNPTLGRFIQRDPNEAAQPIMTACAMNGDVLQLFAHLSIQGQYGDGMNLYQYCDSNPVNKRDPSGLASVTTQVLIKLLDNLAKYFGIHIIPPGCTGLVSDMVETAIKIFKYWKDIGLTDAIVSLVKNALKIAIQALKTGIMNFIDALINVGRIASSYVLQALRVMGSAGASVLSFLADAAIAAAPYMAVIGVFVLAGYAGYFLAEWLGPYLDELAESLWQIRWKYAQGVASRIVAPIFKAADNYRMELDLFMDDIDANWGNG